MNHHDSPPIRKELTLHGGSGGSWKVAYADFVTSLMALFLVLWLVSSDEATKEAVQRYFRGEITEQGNKGVLLHTDIKPFSVKASERSHNDLIAVQDLKRATERLRNQFNNSASPGEDLIRFEFTADGLRLTVLDRSKKPFFFPGTAELTDWGKWILETVAWEIERYPFDVEVEGHVEKSPREAKGWDLSSSRAVSAQEALQGGGVKPKQFWRVAGYADRKPMNKDDPAAEENRRISIIIRPNEDQYFNGLN